MPLKLPKKQLAAFFALSAAIGVVSAGAHAQSDNQIVPGVRIGRTHVGPNGSTYLANLPKPDAADAAMSHLEEVWVSRRKGHRPETLFLATTRNGALNVPPLNGTTIDDIRVTSSIYHLASGLHTGNTLATIQRRYTAPLSNSDTPYVYTDRAHGIAFEFSSDHPTAKSRCIAIHVLTPKGSGNIAIARQVEAVLKKRPPALLRNHRSMRRVPR